MITGSTSKGRILFWYDVNMRSRPIDYRKLGIHLCALAIIECVLVFFWRDNVVLACLFLLATLVVFLWHGFRRHVVASYIVGFILGPTLEMIVIRSGTWQYTLPTFGGIPLWLPLLWGLTTAIVVQIAGCFADA